MIWPLLWIAAMLGLVIATVVVALGEKKARAKLAKSQAPMSMDEPADLVGGEEAGGFGDDAFGEPAEFAEMDEGAFK